MASDKGSGSGAADGMQGHAVPCWLCGWRCDEQCAGAPQRAHGWLTGEPPLAVSALPPALQIARQLESIFEDPAHGGLAQAFPIFVDVRGVEGGGVGGWVGGADRSSRHLAPARLDTERNL